MNETFKESSVTLQFGIVTEIAKGRAKVKIQDMDDFITDWIPVSIAGDTQDNKHFAMPAVGAQVSILLDARGERGVITGCIYSDVDEHTSPNNESVHTKYKDGAIIEYNPEESTLLIQDVKDIKIIAKGDVDATVEGNVKIKATGNIDATSEGNISFKAGGSFSVDAQSISIASQSFTNLSAPSSITLQTPMTLITGGLAGGFGGGARSRTMSAANYEAIFYIPVRFIEGARFIPTPEMPDINVAGTLYLDHIHKDSIGGDTDPPDQ